MRDAQLLSRAVSNTGLFKRSRRVGCYLAHDGEMDLTPLIKRLWKMNKTVYLPVLRRQRLWFLPFAAHTPLANNRFGIPEPVAPPEARCTPQVLDLVLMPLVAFDNEGHRLGMGGGFYDRTFAYRLHRRHWIRPHLIGVAYDLQRVPVLPTRPWDVPMDGVATESGVRVFSRK